MLDKKRKEHVKNLERAVKEIFTKFSDKAEKISIFGSYARGKRDLFTDLDVLIIMESNKPFLERLKNVYSSLNLKVDADILCYTPEEFERIKDKPFFKRILKEEVVLFERKSN